MLNKWNNFLISFIISAFLDLSGKVVQFLMGKFREFLLWFFASSIFFKPVVRIRPYSRKISCSCMFFNLPQLVSSLFQSSNILACTLKIETVLLVARYFDEFNQEVFFMSRVFGKHSFTSVFIFLRPIPCTLGGYGSFAVLLSRTSLARILHVYFLHDFGSIML